MTKGPQECTTPEHMMFSNGLVSLVESLSKHSENPEFYILENEKGQVEIGYDETLVLVEANYLKGWDVNISHLPASDCTSDSESDESEVTEDRIDSKDSEEAATPALQTLRSQRLKFFNL